MIQLAAKKTGKSKPSLRDKMSAAFSKMQRDSRRAMDKQSYGEGGCPCGRKGCKGCGC